MRCPGYRNELDLLFRNENDHVKRRSSSIHARALSVRATASTADCLDETSSGVDLYNKSIDYGLYQDAMLGAQTYPLDHGAPTFSLAAGDQAKCFLLKNFITSDSEILNQLWSNTRSEYRPKPLADAIESLGFAGLSNFHNNPHFMIIARSKYALALEATISSLGAQHQADIKRNIRVAIVLGLFEVSISSFHAHYLKLTYSEDGDCHFINSVAMD